MTLYVVPGRQSAGPLSVLGLVLAVAAVGVLLRPVLAGLAVVLGSFGLLLLGILSQAIVLDVAIAVSPNVNVGGGPEVFLISWIAAVVAAAVNWTLDQGSDDTFLAQLLGRAIRVAHRHRSESNPRSDSTLSEVPKLLVIQLDGVGEQLLRRAMISGEAPTLAGWLEARTHTLRGWHTGLPATTPAGQAVLLHGDENEVPSFRWFEKETARMMVANHPSDAAEIERRISDGRGLLAVGGVSVSNLFSGDAAVSLLTMSDARLPPRHTHGLASFATMRGGLVRSVVVAAGQVVAELYQGRRQRLRHVQPRVRRGAVFAVQRAVTSALLRDLDLAIVAEQLARGAPAIYVNFLDYDEIAHHAGPTRPESMQALAGLDHLVQFFADVVTETEQNYEIAIVSDHGQAQGATFAQLSGQTLTDLVNALAASDQGRSRLGVAQGPAERWGSANLLLTGLARSGSVAGRLVTRGRTNQIADSEPEVTVPDVRSNQAFASRQGTAFIVAAAGSLAHLYLADVPGRVAREEIDRRHPNLIDGLVNNPYIGAVMVRSDEFDAPTVVGSEGWRVLGTAGPLVSEGVDPTVIFGPHAAADLLALDRRQHVGDLIVLGRFDPITGEVAAFEELVGSHGGLGGDQTEALLLHPATWPVPTGGVLTGLDVHDLLRSRTSAHQEAAS